MEKNYIYGYLNEEIVTQCEKAIEKIREIRLKSDRPLVPAELFEGAEFLHSFRAWLTSHILEAEARYRDMVQVNRGQDMSVSAAETQAKTSPEYRAFRYLQRVDELAEEQILIVKRFMTRMGEEYRESGGL